MTICNYKSWEAEVVQSDIPVFVDFWATWCGPSRIIKPIIDELSDEYRDKVKFVRVNIEEMEHLAKPYDLLSLPTVLILHKESLLYSEVGMGTEQTYKKIIDKALALLATGKRLPPATGSYEKEPPKTPTDHDDY